MFIFEAAFFCFWRRGEGERGYKRMGEDGRIGGERWGEDGGEWKKEGKRRKEHGKRREEKEREKRKKRKEEEKGEGERLLRTTPQEAAPLLAQPLSLL